MKLIKQNRHKRDRYVKLHNEYNKNHIYLINGKSHIERGYQSVTTFLKQFFDEFNADEIIEKYYDKWQNAEHKDYHGKSKDAIKAMWEDKRDTAADAGTHMHAQFENYCNVQAFERIPEFNNFMKWLTESGIKPYRTEMTIYHPKLKLIGNVDLLAKDKDGNFIIVDYKRSEKPANISYGRMTRGGLNLPDTKIVKHALQLSIYKYIYETMYDIKIHKIYNLYIKDDYIEFVQQKEIDLEPVFKPKLQ